MDIGEEDDRVVVEPVRLPLPIPDREPPPAEPADRPVPEPAREPLPA